MAKITNQTAEKARAPKTEEVNWRALGPINELGLTDPMRQAALELAQNWSYSEAAKKAGVSPEIVRGWTLDPAFIAAIGWLVIGLADNQE